MREFREHPIRAEKPIHLIKQIENHLLRAPDSEEVRCALDLIAICKKKFFTARRKRKESEGG